MSINELIQHLRLAVRQNPKEGLRQIAIQLDEDVFFDLQFKTGDGMPGESFWLMSPIINGQRIKIREAKLAS